MYQRLSSLSIVRIHGRKDVDVDLVITSGGGGVHSPIPLYDCMWIRNAFEVSMKSNKTLRRLAHPRRAGLGLNTLTAA